MLLLEFTKNNSRHNDAIPLVAQIKLKQISNTEFAMDSDIYFHLLTNLTKSEQLELVSREVSMTGTCTVIK